ncbi:protein of unknown function [Nocardia cyriacigeorgica GUH-2]|uniref:Uncharacterized protein n=1 Tax=Nocardia cyriacigeorgica (strain GUH-2) TaxID=1127134 RepID=H6RCA0_NOCCG|nr:protein of unknown function [Nocardia cyriacigeorgica GUH-2]
MPSLNPIRSRSRRASTSQTTPQTPAERAFREDHDIAWRVFGKPHAATVIDSAARRVGLSCAVRWASGAY